MDEKIKEKILNGTYENYISLGMNCRVATDMETLCLRNCSSPYDWVWSRWNGIESGLNGDFDYLHYRKLYQKKSAPHTYKNEEYGISMPHDFNKYEPLIFQLNGVKKKYKRRIDRFNENIKKPTLFFRYCYNSTEINYLSENYDKIDRLIKSHCKDNDILFLIPDSGVSYTTPPPKSVVIHVPDGAEICEHPLTDNEELYNVLLNAKLSSKQANSGFETQKKATAKKQKLIVRFFKKYFKNFTYIHIRRY